MNKEEYAVQVSLGILTPAERVRLARCENKSTERETLEMLAHADPQPVIRRLAISSLLTHYGVIYKSEE